MITIRWSSHVMVAAVAVVSWSGAALADTSTLAERCEARKTRAAGAMAQCLARERARALEGRTPNFAKCETSLDNAFAAAEKSAQGMCRTTADYEAIEAQVDACMAIIA